MPHFSKLTNSECETQFKKKQGLYKSTAREIWPFFSNIFSLFISETLSQKKGYQVNILGT